MLIHANGAWEGEDVAAYHHFDQNLCHALSRVIIGPRVLDLGCGLGKYVKHLRSVGYIVAGYDGNPDTPKYGKALYYADLTARLDLPRANTVISLEVGEHIPEPFADVYLDNVVEPKPQMVVLSWGLPNQKGDGHVNCQPNDYAIARMLERGYEHRPELSKYLRSWATFYWFKQSLMVFTCLPS